MALRAFRGWFSVAPSCLGREGAPEKFWIRQVRVAGALDLVAGAGSAVAGWRRRLHNARRAEVLRAHRVMQGPVRIDL